MGIENQLIVEPGVTASRLVRIISNAIQISMTSDGLIIQGGCFM